MERRNRKRAWRNVLLSAAVAASSIAFSGCYGPEYAEAGITIGGPPPGVRVEARLTAPDPRYIWVPGYWDWDGHWGWVGGVWQLPPHAHARWVAPRYRRSHGNWVYYRGHWR